MGFDGQADLRRFQCSARDTRPILRQTACCIRRSREHRPMADHKTLPNKFIPLYARFGKRAVSMYNTVKLVQSLDQPK
jgi:hypothetical protein